MAGENFLQVNKSMVCLSRLHVVGQGRILHGSESPVCGPLAEGLLCCSSLQPSLFRHHGLEKVLMQPAVSETRRCHLPP